MDPPGEPLSWRDPDGFVVRHQGRILRAIAPDKAAQYRALIGSPWLAKFVADGSVPESVEIAPPSLAQADRFVWLEHREIGFPCHPHEITALQLHDSALLTLKIAQAAAENGWTLKDASAWNVLHSGGRPVFVDLLSFEPLQPTGTWMAYGQFVRHFVLPLLLFRKIGLTPPAVFLLDRDGVTPERAGQLLRGLQRASPTALEFAVLPALLSPAGSRRIGTEQRTHATRRFEPAMARELLQGRLRRLERKVAGLMPRWAASTSTWLRYEEERSHYSPDDLALKARFVEDALAGCGSAVLDLGCNAGEFSALAARLGKSVVAADFDHSALERLYSRVREGGMPISPLMLNIGRPTPAIGWENREVRSFLERAAGRFDAILVLGLIHHLLVSERATVPMIVALLERLGPRHIILEWIEPADPKFQQLAGLNMDLYRQLDSAQIEAQLSMKFRLISKIRLPSGTRVMYLWSQ